MNDQTITQLKGGAAGLLGVLIIGLNQKLALGLDPMAQGLIASMVLGYYAFLGHQTASANKLAAVAPDAPVDPVVKVTAPVPLPNAELIAKAVAEALKPAAPVLLAVLAGILLLAPAQASAQALSLGPAAPLMAITPGDSHPVAFSPGTGFSVSCDLLATKLNGQPVYWFSPGAAILGTASSNGTTTALGVSAALYVAVLGLVTIGVGAPLIDSLNNGLFQHPDKRTPFIMFGLDHGFGTFLNALGIGHAPPPAPVDKPIDGDHPNGV